MMQSAHPSFSNPNSILLLKKRLNASLKEKKESFLDGCILEMKKEEWGEESQLLEGCARLMSFKPHDTPQQEDGVTRSRMFPPPGDSDPLSACTSCLRSCDVKAAQQHQLQYRDADIQLRRA